MASDTFLSALRMMKPEHLVGNVIKTSDKSLTINGKGFDWPVDGNMYVLGAGKASAAMAAGLERSLGNRIRDGIVISPAGTSSVLNRIQAFPGSHPLPDEDTLASTLELMAFARSIPKGSLVVFLMSGGASSLMECPEDGIELEDLQSTYNLLLKSGAGIHEMNLVRKHLSAVKGGKLLQLLDGCKVINLILSDVPGDDPRHIGSGPTVPEPSTKADALKVIGKYGLEDKLPQSVLDFLSVDADGSKEPVTEPENFLIGTSLIFAQTAAGIIEKNGFDAEVLPEAYDAPVEQVADIISKKIKKSKGRKALIFHGESTVNVTGGGLGGRNQHLALLVAEAISGMENVVLLSAGTDGRDGPVDAAGAIADGTTLRRAKAMGLDPAKTVSNFDSYHFFKSLGDLIFTGPTGNNLMDFQLVLIDR